MSNLLEVGCEIPSTTSDLDESTSDEHVIESGPQISSEAEVAWIDEMGRVVDGGVGGVENPIVGSELPSSPGRSDSAAGCCLGVELRGPVSEEGVRGGPTSSNCEVGSEPSTSCASSE